MPCVTRTAPSGRFDQIDGVGRMKSMNETPTETEPTLNQMLARLGYTKKPAGSFYSAYSYHILDGKRIVFTGDSKETWAWINKGRP